MYKYEEEKNKDIEINLHPINKWRRILVYLGDMFLSFIAAVLLLSIAVMPIASIFVKPETDKAVAAEHIIDDILYEHELLFYKTPENTGNYPKYDLNSNLRYTYNRFLAFYVFDDETSLDSEYPEYCHLTKNETIYHYYHGIKGDDITYYEIFKKHAEATSLFLVTDSSVSLKDDVKSELRVFYKPGESLGTKGQEYYNAISDIYSALFGMVIKDIRANDLKDYRGNSYNVQQDIINKISQNYYMVVAICSGISYILGWLIIHIVYPLINKSGRTPTMSIMKVDRIGFRNLMELNKGEVALVSSYFFALDMPYLIFLPLSYTTFTFLLKVPVLPILAVLSLLMVIASLFVILFNSFNRSLSDVLSQSVMVPSEEMDGIIKAQETIKELQLNQERNKK